MKLYHNRILAPRFCQKPFVLSKSSLNTKLYKMLCVSVQFSLVAKSCPMLCDPMDCSTPGFPVHHQLPELSQTHVHQVGDVIQSSHSLSSPYPPAFNLSQHQGLFQWVSPLHQVAKVLEFQLQHQSFQWTPRTDLLQNGLVGSPCSVCLSLSKSFPLVLSLTHIYLRTLSFCQSVHIY